VAAKEAPKLAFNVEREGGVARVYLTGAICEYSDLGRIAREVVEPEVHLDLAGVDRINSAGLRDWLDFIHRFTERRQVFFTRMSPPMVRNLNMIGSLVGQGRLLSVMAPYMCEPCDEMLNIVVDLAQSPSSATKPICSKCNEPMEFADLWSMYFAFLQN
jgi:hypothetical protein